MLHDHSFVSDTDHEYRILHPNMAKDSQRDKTNTKNVGKEACQCTSGTPCCEGLVTLCRSVLYSVVGIVDLRVWALIGHVPEEYFYLLVSFDNLGGVFNLGVYIIIRRQRLTKTEKNPTV